MTSIRTATIAAILVLSSQGLLAQDLSRYREYALGSNLASVVASAGADVSDVRTVHERPSTIQQLEWRAPSWARTDAADPVRDIEFSFFEDQLYQIVVTYDRGRMEGLTNGDVMASLSSMYGQPLPSRGATARRPLEVDSTGETVIVGRWESAAVMVTLTRGTYAAEFQLVLVSKSLATLARTASTASVRLDAREAPGRERAERAKEAADAAAASDKARIANKAAFRP